MKKTPLGAILSIIFDLLGVTVNQIHVRLNELLQSWTSKNECYYCADPAYCDDCSKPEIERYYYFPKKPVYDKDGNTISQGDEGVKCDRWISCMELLINESGNGAYVNYIINKRNYPKDEACIRILTTYIFTYCNDSILNETRNQTLEDISNMVQEKIINRTIALIDNTKYDISKITQDLKLPYPTSKNSTEYFKSLISWILQKIYNMGKSKLYKRKSNFLP